MPEARQQTSKNTYLWKHCPSSLKLQVSIVMVKSACFELHAFLKGILSTVHTYNTLWHSESSALKLCGMGREEILPKCHAAKHPSCPGSLLRKDKVFQFKMCAGRNVLAEHLHRNHQSFWVSSEVLFRDHLFGLTDKLLTASITLTFGWAEYVSARLEQQRAAEPAAGKVHQGMTDG